MAKKSGDNSYRFDIFKDGPLERDLGAGNDLVSIDAPDAVKQIRLTFTSSEVGNGSADDSNTLANQDGGLAVRVQAEYNVGKLRGPESRFDDEGIVFKSNGKFTFDVRDLVSGVQRGDTFDVVKLGTSGADNLYGSDKGQAYYLNGGMGADKIIGGFENDFLVGGSGDDVLSDRAGDDSFIGGGGNDLIFAGSGNDTVIFAVATDGRDKADLGTGNDTVNITAPVTAAQVRLTFTSSEVGNNDARDSDTMANQDGSLAVRLRAEDGSGGLTGFQSRFDDEGVSFVSTVAGVTFDVRDLVSGVARGDQFNIVRLGTSGNDTFSEIGKTASYYINAGMGDDSVTGGQGRDFLVGGAGNDMLNGLGGKDSFIGGGGSDVFVFAESPGSDTINDFVSGTDKIDFRMLDIDFNDIQTSVSGSDTLLKVDTNGNGTTNFTITLLNVAAPSQSDFLFS
ncbi:calcium-binding protein [Pararhizobium gei]|uniref:calcium-binding protein n=1 Tax=Pararhizobium gei TaxID=1395951 RepID=UPI0023DAD55D|nr:calcium-binding protein [Rhizobium gei]